MKALKIFRMMVMCGLLVGVAGASEAACEPDGEIQFLCGPVSPEDLAPVPDSPWVIVSSMIDEGYLHLADTRDHTSTVLFPTETSRPQHDTATYGACPGPLTRQFRPHGLNLRIGNDGTHTLYVVSHGARESIEVFEVDMGGGTPSLTWVGCAVAPEPLGLNSVVALPEGGFAATSPRTLDIWDWPHRDRVEPRAGQRGDWSEWVGDLSRRPMVLCRWLRQPVVDPPVARTDTGREGGGGSWVPYRQRPMGSG